MNANARTFMSTSFFFWTLCAIGSVIYLFTFKDGRLSLREDRVQFGIDLVGGSYITLAVEYEKAIEIELYSAKEHLLQKLKSDGLELPVSHNVQNNGITYTFASAQACTTAMNAVTTNHDNRFLYSGQNNVMTMTLKDIIQKNIEQNAIRSNIEILKGRLDQFGLGEIAIAAQGERNIIIELPNVDDPQKAKAMIGKAAVLEIKLVEKIAPDQDELLEEYDGEIPDDMMIISGKDDERHGKKLYYLIPKYTDLTGRLLKYVGADIGGKFGAEYVINFEFNSEGSSKFYEITSANRGRQLAIVLDGAVLMAPTINEPIRGVGSISGNFDQNSAKELAMLLKSGSFVAPVKFVQERRIGPSLGQESIYKGLTACIIGMILLFVFSVIIYKLCGFFAFITLIYNLLLILLFLSFFHATLTLPGIAGMILTVGMAIDASILIYEKIREELAHGKSIHKAVDEGFSDAMAVILDSNITTFLVGVVLYYFGTGPVQGFAITMMVGIVATLLTGLFFLKSLFTFYLNNFNPKKLSI